MDPLAWAALLLIFGLFLVGVEIFVPSGGILAFLSLAAIIAGIVMAFYYRGATVGMAFIGIAVVALPIILAAGFHFLPQTAVGRRLLASVPTEAEVLPDNEELRQLKQLVGKYGEAQSMMLPSGAVLIEGRTIDAYSDGQPIDPGQTVKVIEVRGTRVMVRRVEPGQQAAAARSARTAEDDILAQPFESLGLDPFNDPLS